MGIIKKSRAESPKNKILNKRSLLDEATTVGCAGEAATAGACAVGRVAGFCLGDDMKRYAGWPNK
jgi:hypothetical protein